MNNSPQSRNCQIGWSAILLLALATNTVAPRAIKADLLDGLISYWPFDGDGTDLSPFERDLTLQGSVGFAPGLFGQALDLHKNQNTYAQRLVDDAAYDFGGNDFTVHTWVNYYSTATEQVLIEKFTGGSGPGWTFTKRAEQSVQFYGGGVHSSAPQSISIDNWHQLVVRRTGSQIQIRLDGTAIVNRTITTITNSGTPLYVGRRNPADSRDFSLNGRLDEVAIWNRAITDTDLAYLYNKGLGNPIIPGADLGDFNGDGIYDCLDVDALVGAIASQTNNPIFDITGDMLVDLADRDAWLAIAGAANLASGNSFPLGDANLDGTVDGQDYIIWNDHKFSFVAAWCSGDFTADGVVDGQDFIKWNNNKFTSAYGMSVVPEPASHAWSIVAMLVAAASNVRWKWTRREEIVGQLTW